MNAADLVTVELEDNEANLEERLVIYRQMMQLALEQLADITHQLRRLRGQHDRLREEYRRLLREQVLRREVA